MKYLHRITLRTLPGPFFGWLLLLLFLLLMQFLIKYLPDLAGRDLPLGLILELITYNLAYMFVLAVPMSALLATLMAFGSLAESRAYVVIKASGIPALRIIWPSLAVGLALTGAMTYFNNVLYPESNFRARNIWEDVHAKRPGFDLQPGVFYDGLADYAILVQRRDGNTLEDILIYDRELRQGKSSTIKAQTGTLEPQGLSVALNLHNGEIHRLRSSPFRDHERYERLYFDRLRLTLDLSDFTFERTSPTEGPRSDRSTQTSVMVAIVDSLQANIDALRSDIQESTSHLATASGTRNESSEDSQRIYAFAGESARQISDDANRMMQSIERQQRWMNRYKVEIHKKYSIATACLIFILLGAPLGLSIRRGGLGISAIVALGVFLLYWATLVQGEKLADRGFLEPWISMWVANGIVGFIAAGAFLYVALDLRNTPPLYTRFLRKKSR